MGMPGKMGRLKPANGERGEWDGGLIYRCSGEEEEQCRTRETALFASVRGSAWGIPLKESRRKA